MKKFISKSAGIVLGLTTVPTAAATWSTLSGLTRIAPDFLTDEGEENPSTSDEGQYEAVLKPAEGTGIAGTIHIEKKPDELALELQVKGLKPGASVEIAFHNPIEITGPDDPVDSLVGTPLAVNFPARTLKADTNGQITATAVLEDSESLPFLAGKIVALHPVASSPRIGIDVPAPMSDPLAFGTFERRANK